MRSISILVIGVLLEAVYAQSAVAQNTAQTMSRPSVSDDAIDYQQSVQRGSQAVIWGIVAMQALRESAARDLGATFNDIIYMSKPPAPRQAILTATNETPYVVVLLNTADGPVVLDVPPASKTTLFFGTVVDAWQLPLTDVGPSGADEGKGGKYLFVPPGYTGDIPAGYIAFRPNTIHLYVALRPVPIGGGTPEQAVAYSQSLKAYPLAQAASPSPDRYIDASLKVWNTLPSYDLSYFKLLSAAINDEPVQARDLAMMGLLSSLGINKGQPFNLDPTTTKALTKAASDGYDQMQRYYTMPGGSFAPIWPGNQWQVFNVPRAQIAAGFPFETPDRLMIDERAGGYFGLAFYPKKLGKASFLGLKLQVLHARTDEEIDAVFASLPELRVGALVIGTDPLFTSRAEKLGALSLRSKIPAIYQYRTFTAAGGVMSYGGNITDSYYHAGLYAGRILKGEKPADLPVQLSTKVELFLNLKSAEALGIKPPLSLLGRADEVIE
jgi:hypothetical protein